MSDQAVKQLVVVNRETVDESQSYETVALFKGNGDSLDIITPLIASGIKSDPILLDPVQWALVYIESSSVDYTYANGTAGVGATITSNINGALIESNSYNNINPEQLCGYMQRAAVVGDRVFLADNSNESHQGIYSITDLGSVSTPWVMTRVPEMDDAQDSLMWFIFVIENTSFVVRTDKDSSSDSFNNGSMGFSLMPSSGFASGSGALALGVNAVAIGNAATAEANHQNIGKEYRHSDEVSGNYIPSHTSEAMFTYEDHGSVGSSESIYLNSIVSILSYTLSDDITLTVDDGGLEVFSAHKFTLLIDAGAFTLTLSGVTWGGVVPTITGTHIIDILAIYNGSTWTFYASAT